MFLNKKIAFLTQFFKSRQKWKFFFPIWKCIYFQTEPIQQNKYSLYLHKNCRNKIQIYFKELAPKQIFQIAIFFFSLSKASRFIYRSPFTVEKASSNKSYSLFPQKHCWEKNTSIGLFFTCYDTTLSWEDTLLKIFKTWAKR